MGLFDRRSRKKTPPPSVIVDDSLDTAESDSAAESDLDEDPPTPAAETDMSNPSYGIDQAMELLAGLPVQQHPELVAHVVKQTLESAKVQFEAIIDDAQQRQAHIRDEIRQEKAAIEALRQQIAQRATQVSGLERDLAEVKSAKSTLLLAQQRATEGQAAAAPRPAAPQPAVETTDAPA